MKNRILAGCLSAVFLLSGAVPARAADSGAVYSDNVAEQIPAFVQQMTQEKGASGGTCGTNLTWKLDNAGTLTISGTGEMADDSFGWEDSCDSIKKLVVADGVTSIADYAFSWCENLAEVAVADSVKSIGGDAFYACYSLKSVSLGSGLETIGSWAFASCTDLEQLSLPAGVNSVGRGAFSGCGSLKRLYFCGEAPALGDDIFEDVTATVYYPAGSSSWNAAIQNKDQYGGTIRWRSWNPDRVLALVDEVFSDVTRTDWFYDKVQYVYDNDLMVGDKGRFMPNHSLTRAMAVQILYANAKACGTYKAVTGKTFQDVAPDAWYYDAVQWASGAGITSGTGDGKFEPDARVTREQVAVFLYQDAGAPFVGGTIRFSDAGNVSSWAKDAMLWAIRSGIICGSNENGKLLLRPKGKATRAETATMLKQYLEPSGRTALTSSSETYEERMARIFGDGATERKYASKSEAEKFQTSVTVKVWDINSKGVKYTRTLKFKIHIALVDTIEQIFAEIYASGEKFPIYSIGGYAWRGDNSSSEHCLGTALDINPDENYQCKNDGTALVGSYWKPGVDPYSIPSDGIVVKTFNKYGFRWGGTFNSSKDYMHFSYFGT
ncbi:S-layer homology domain-containing protein [Butyricicoccus sp.]|uniref:S-layer homology domain-containing protein n=1 Tax=Butyricicoccus sp. TaxID=2049021 RepID=UPI0037355976